ncbi:hypothetical protein HED60_23760 [Planctomycetales bacterium ZRK34]|nr:hypothetical protein HED60_23760 [Planctomycetales bacterium ZRK34]
MTFSFSGIFANAGSESMDAFLESFDGIGKIISTPFCGYGVLLTDHAIYLSPNDDLDIPPIATQYVKFSERFPNVTFVYLYAECFGGRCDYAGFVFQSGERIHDEPFRDDVNDDTPLRRLVSYLGVELGNPPYFEPLARNYFSVNYQAVNPQQKQSLLVRLFGSILRRSNH